MVDDSIDQMFITDKRGQAVFFPWGSKKQGYYIKESIAPNTKKFIKTSFLVCLILLMIALPFFGNNFWGIIGSMAICLGGWCFAYLIYFSKIVKSLQPSKANYTELILENEESEESKSYEFEEQNQTEFPAQWNKPIPQTNHDPLLGVKRIWYSLSPGRLFILLFFFGSGIFAIYINIIKHRMWERPFDFLITFLVCVICGFACFIFAKSMEVGKKDWVSFLNWKFPMISITIILWGLALYSLYKFFIMIFI